jgi:hypothetical protein
MKKKATGYEASVRIKAAVATLERSVLEAQLSLQLLRKKLREQNPRAVKDEDTSEKIREIGLRLNKARIKKRTYDYLAEESD